MSNTYLQLVAQNFLAPATVKAVKQMLGDSSSSYLTTAATRGASYAATDAGAWFAPQQYMTYNNDTPPSSCDNSYTQCYAHGCSNSAFDNFVSPHQARRCHIDESYFTSCRCHCLLLHTNNTQTGILTDTPVPYNAANKTQALTLIIGLFAMMSSPLDNDLFTGADINVNFNGAATTLYNAHTVLVPQTLGTSTQIASYILGNMSAPASSTSPYAYTTANMTSWLENLSTCWVMTTSIQWPYEANQLVCSAVYAGLSAPNAIAGKELGTKSKWYKTQAPVVQMQIARAGYRMAAMLNLLFKGEPALAVPDTAIVPMCNTTALTKAGTAFKNA